MTTVVGLHDYSVDWEGKTVECYSTRITYDGYDYIHVQFADGSWTNMSLETFSQALKTGELKLFGGKEN